MLMWQEYSLPHEYDTELAAKGYYTKLQKQRSDAALDAFDQANPFESSEELKAFRKLEEMGIYSQADYFSPTKAKDGCYAKELKRFLHGTSNAKGAAASRRARVTPDPERTRTEAPAADAEQGRRAGRRLRRERQRSGNLPPESGSSTDTSAGVQEGTSPASD